MKHLFETFQPQRLTVLIAITMALASLACAFLGSATPRVVIRERLPTLTPTPRAQALLANPTSQPVPQAAQIAPPAPAPAPPLNPTAPPPSSELAAVIPTAIPVNNPPSLTALVNLNVRSGPSVDYPILGKISPGQSFQIAGKSPDGGWWQVIYPPESGGLAWVTADAQYSTASSVEAVAIAQLPPPPLPTATPIALPTLPPPPIPAQATLAFNSSSPGLANTPGLESVPVPVPEDDNSSGSSGWAFAGVRVYTDQDQGGLLLHGKAVNNTGAAQELLSINGIFYDGQGQVIADHDDSYAYWPGYVVPPGGSVPFELLVDGIGEPANFDLSVEAQPSDQTPRQDFNVSNVNQQTEDDVYCLAGELRNPGSDLEDYLIIAAVLYDAQDNVLNFGDYEEFGSIEDSASNFEICIDRPNQDIARYEVVAWGR